MRNSPIPIFRREPHNNTPIIPRSTRPALLDHKPNNLIWISNMMKNFLWIGRRRLILGLIYWSPLRIEKSSLLQLKNNQIKHTQKINFKSKESTQTIQQKERVLRGQGCWIEQFLQNFILSIVSPRVTNFDSSVKTGGRAGHENAVLILLAASLLRI